MVFASILHAYIVSILCVGFVNWLLLIILIRPFLLVHQSPKKGKEAIALAIGEFEEMNRRRPNSFLLRTFFDAKGDEIEQIFSDGPNVEITDLIATLNRVAPMYSSKWRSIKF